MSLKVSGGINVEITEFHGNLMGKEAVFGLSLMSPMGGQLGILRMAIMPEAQAANEDSAAIDGFDEYVSKSAAAQKVLEGLSELGRELAAKSHMLELVEEPAVPTEPPAPVE